MQNFAFISPIRNILELKSSSSLFKKTSMQLIIKLLSGQKFEKNSSNNQTSSNKNKNKTNLILESTDGGLMIGIDSELLLILLISK